MTLKNQWTHYGYTAAPVQIEFGMGSNVVKYSLVVPQNTLCVKFNSGSLGWSVHDLSFIQDQFDLIRNDIKSSGLNLDEVHICNIHSVEKIKTYQLKQFGFNRRHREYSHTGETTKELILDVYSPSIQILHPPQIIVPATTKCVLLKNGKWSLDDLTFFVRTYSSIFSDDDLLDIEVPKEFISNINVAKVR